ncbi:MAG: dual specificity protein phosphatase family protein [Candidatus Andersenbacteria bacterium]
MNAHPDHKPLDYDYITDGIYIGTNVCCQVHFDERLAKEGIEADISLEADRVDAPFGVEFYLWLPVVDHTAPTPEQVETGIQMLETLMKLGKKVYVHCKNGHGRAPTLIAAYLVKQGKSVDEAIAFLQTKRSAVHLRDIQEKALRACRQSLTVS